VNNFSDDKMARTPSKSPTLKDANNAMLVLGDDKNHTAGNKENLIAS
jgi:hypothetical protein